MTELEKAYQKIAELKEKTSQLENENVLLMWIMNIRKNELLKISQKKDNEWSVFSEKLDNEGFI